MFALLTIFFLQFADKAGSNLVCLSPTAMEMREDRGIAIDSLDYAVSPVYLDSIKSLGAKVLHTSRWMNGATIEASSETIEALEQCSFVDTIYTTRLANDSSTIHSVSLRKRVAATNDNMLDTKPLNSNGQLQLINLPPS